MRFKCLIILCLIGLATALTPRGNAWADYAFSLTLYGSDAITPKTWFEPGDAFYVQIGINDAGGVAGCAFTLEYPSDVVIPPVIDRKGVSDEISSLFPFTFNSDETHRGNVGGPGKLHLAGAAIALDGGSVHAAGPVGLFWIGFTVSGDAQPGKISLALKQTQLSNPSAGYDSDNDKVAVLMGALNNTHEDWADPVKAFPNLLPEPPTVLVQTSLDILDSSSITPPSIALPGYDPETHSTWPLCGREARKFFRHRADRAAVWSGRSRALSPLTAARAISLNSRRRPPALLQASIR